MMTTVTKVQLVAIAYYSAPSPRAGRRPAAATERALLAKELIRERQATDTEKEAIGRPVDAPWRITELTAAGKLLLPDVDVSTYVPAVQLARPADPFAAFETEED
jgi:hypothetical protein